MNITEKFKSIMKGMCYIYICTKAAWAIAKGDINKNSISVQKNLYTVKVWCVFLTFV